MEKYRDNDPGKEQTAYDRLSDEALLRQLRAGDAAIMDYVLDKYKPLVRKKTNAMFLIGGDTDDLIQEGMIGLFKAIRDYREERETSFFHFAELCITRQIYSAIEASNRKKHAPLNSYVSFYSEVSEEGQPLAEYLESERSDNPEQRMIDQENFELFLKKVRQSLSKMECEVLDDYLSENAALALEALEVLGRVGYPTTVEQRKKGLKDTKWNGRLTIIHREPLFIVDGAHNPAAADMLEDSVRKYFKGRKLFFIMGVFRDKDYPYIIRKLCPYAEQIITIETPDNPRALPAQELAEEVKKCNPHVQAADSIPDAVDKIFAMAGREDVILSFGSLSFIGEITTIVKTQEEKNS